MKELRLVIKGRPGIKKNGRPIFKDRRTGRRFLGKSEQLQGMEANAEADLWEQKTAARGVVFPITEKLHATFLFYRDTHAPADLSNLYELVQDALQKTGIIKNDTQIESHDGSRKLYDPDNPRTEIILRPFEE